MLNAKDLYHQHNITPNKQFGQNFLKDDNVLNKIAHLINATECNHFVEIGPGIGALTLTVMNQNQQAVIHAIEKDTQFLPVYHTIQDHYPNQFYYHLQDALKVNLTSFIQELFTNKPVAVFSNLPYNIGTALLQQWVEEPNFPPVWHSLTLMFQLEVALRLIAKPNTEHYSRLSILTQYRFNPSLAFTVKPNSFHPAPKVHSAIVQVIPKTTPIKGHLPTLKTITQLAFNQRRKQLYNSLKPYHTTLNPLIDLERRPETVSVEEWINLSDAVYQANQ